MGQNVIRSWQDGKAVYRLIDFGSATGAQGRRSAVKRLVLSVTRMSVWEVDEHQRRVGEALALHWRGRF
eukprot:754933-Hanusia_phi.AAC.8